MKIGFIKWLGILLISFGITNLNFNVRTYDVNKKAYLALIIGIIISIYSFYFSYTKKMNEINPVYKAGSIIGCVLLALGSVLTGILIFLLFSTSFLPKMLIAGSCLIGVGVGMIAFPGADLSLKDMKKNGAKRFCTESPLVHKCVWTITGGIGLAISFRLIINAGF